MNNFSRYSMLLVLSFTLFINCSEKEENKLEQDIFNTIFNELLDSTITDYRLLVAPSPSDFEDEGATKKLNETLEKKKKEKRSPLIVRINDSIIEIEDELQLYKKTKNHLSPHIYQSLINNPKNNDKQSFKIEISTLEIDKNKYELIYESSFEKFKGVLDNKERLSGICYLSRVLFDKEKTVGLFTLSFVYSGLDGIGVFVLLKNEKDKWIIDKIIEDWNS